MKALWNVISYAGDGRLKDESDLRQLILLNRIVAAAMANFFLLIPVTIYFREPTVTWMLIIGIASLSLCYLFNGAGMFRFSRVFFLIISLVFVSTVLLVSGENAGSEVTFILVAVLHLILFRSSRGALPVLGIVILVFAVSCYIVEHNPSPLDHIAPFVRKTAHYITVLSNILLVFFVVFYFKSLTLAFENELARKNELISQKNKDITDGIHYARRIQDSLMPGEKRLQREMDRLGN